MMSTLAIRPALVADAPAMARVHIDTWRIAYQGIVPAAHLAGLRYEHCQAGWEAHLSDPQHKTHAFVAESPVDEIVGIASCGPPQDPLVGIDGEVYVVYVRQAFQGQGCGQALVRAAVRDLVDRGCRSVVIWVLKENPARRFYERLGGQQTLEKTVEIGGEMLVDVGYTWDDLKLLAGESV